MKYFLREICYTLANLDKSPPLIILAITILCIMGSLTFIFTTFFYLTDGIILWREDKASFGLKSLKGLTNEAYELYHVTAEHNLEIIGNIYENPDLLKG